MELPTRERINIGELQGLATTTDMARARQSAALERELEPELASARTGATSLLGGLLQEGGQLPAYQQQALQQSFQQQQQMPQDIALAREQNMAILRDPSAAFNTPALRNAVFQQAFQAGGGAGLQGRGLQEIGGAFFAKELLGAQQQARQGALQFGGFETDLNQRNLQNRINIADFLDRQREQEFGRALQGTSLLQGIQKPQVGLTGSDLASAKVADVNDQNTFNIERAKLAALQGGKKKKGGLGTLGSIAGGALGFAIGGPAGASLGSSLGGAIGGGIDGGFEGAMTSGLQGISLGGSESFQGFTSSAGNALGKTGGFLSDLFSSTGRTPQYNMAGGPI